MKIDKLDQILMMAWFIMANQQTSVILQLVCAFFGSCYAVLSSYRIVRSWFSPHNAKCAGSGYPGATCSARIFSGPESKALWDEINSIDDFSTPSQIGMCLYSIGCKLQELEAKFHRHNSQADRPQGGSV